MDSYARLGGELATLMRGLKDVNGHVLETAGVRCEAAGAAVLGRLERLGPVRLTDLAQALGLDPSSVSRQVTALERSGWVEREKDPTDLRAQQLHLTDKGREVVAALGRARVQALERLTPGLSTRDIDELTDRLARLNHELEGHRVLRDARQETA
ncbi:MAG: MarR family transcriptional regulator [Frankiales bacterium]|nr:MarR family transcriptional regulator [Frankiales bacterium]